MINYVDDCGFLFIQENINIFLFFVKEYFGYASNFGLSIKDESEFLHECNINHEIDEELIYLKCKIYELFNIYNIQCDSKIK